jgi:hypothetical protein
MSMVAWRRLDKEEIIVNVYASILPDGFDK